MPEAIVTILAVHVTVARQVSFDRGLEAGERGGILLSANAMCSTRTKWTSKYD